MPLVSFIIPTYNHHQYLQDAVQSALNQVTDLDIEIIIVNDNSNDNTADLKINIEHHPKITWLDHSTNRGKLAALNTASSHCHGDFIIVLDSDDELESNYVEKCYAHLNKTLADFVYTSCNLIDSTNQVIGYGKSMPFVKDNIDRYSFIPDLAFTSREGFFSGVPYDESVRVLPKHFRWKLLCKLGLKGAYLEDNLFRYRMHDNNMSGIGLEIQKNLVSGKTDHHLLSGYWKARELAAS